MADGTGWATIGRKAPLGAAAADWVVVRDRELSSRHAQLGLGDGGKSLWLTDAQSVNGTFVNGARLSERRQWSEAGKEIGGSGGSLEPLGPLLTHLHTVYLAYSECLPTRAPLEPPG